MDDFFVVATAYLSFVWEFFVETDIPFLGFSAASLLVGSFLIGFSIKLLGKVLHTDAGRAAYADRFREKKG